MLKTEISLSDVFDFFKKHQIQTWNQEIDEFGGLFIKASTLAAIIISPDPASKITAFTAGVGVASFRVSTLLSWLPEKFKYKNKGRDLIAIQRYELSAYINFVLLQIAIKNGIKEVVLPYIQNILSEISITEAQKNEIQKQCTIADEHRETLTLPVGASFNNDDFSDQALYLIEPMLSNLLKIAEGQKKANSSLKKIDYSKIKNSYLNLVTLNYQAFLIHCAGEFPEFALWADISSKTKIVKELKATEKLLTVQAKKSHHVFLLKVEKLIKEIEELKSVKFIADSGFPSFLENYERLFKRQEEFLSKSSQSKILDNINAHHTEILKELTKPLSENTDVDGIVYPKNKNIYIAQSFEAITYKRKEHRKSFLTSNQLSDSAENGENIGNYLLQCLADPASIYKPIILLGNPGAGKSMLSKMFAGLLCDTTDYIPFLIKLRTVASSSTSISEHINKGLANSIENSSEINWLDWAKEFKERMPVIIMDGFDELMQTSNRELNGYVDAIRDFQEKAISNNVCVRIILTSRITVMQDVSIAEGTKIIKLNSFDEERRNLWIKKWNSAQVKPVYKFIIPDNEKIMLLAKEPLLMFMLAVYDFENSELQEMANDKTFNQSKLYDSLLNKFIKRQLVKDDRYNHASTIVQLKEDEIFRLRLGMIALMMFMNDTTSRDTQKLKEEMIAFGIQQSTFQTDNILGGFFFIHENKSVTDSHIEKFNYEFLHKTFGEFLTADFLLRIALKQYSRLYDNSQDIIAKKETFQFCFGYNWLHKHYNILNFLFEHGKQLIEPETPQHKFVINNIIKNDLKELFDKVPGNFPVTDFRLLEKKSLIEHLSIYSQNLIFLWLSISEDNKSILFDIYEIGVTEPHLANEPKYESQDRDEIYKNKKHWKQIAGIWGGTENHGAVAKLKEWVGVNETNDSIELRRFKNEVTHNFSDAAEVSCNDFEQLLAYFDNDCKIPTHDGFLIKIDKMLNAKPELTNLANDVILHRFADLFDSVGFNLLEFIAKRELSKRQQVMFIRKFGLLKWRLGLNDIERFFYEIVSDIYFIIDENPIAAIELLKILVDLKSLPLTIVLPPGRLEEILNKISRDIESINLENPYAVLEYISILTKLNKSYSLRRRSKLDFLDESLYVITRELPKLLANNPYTFYEYIKLINEIRLFYPVNRKMNPTFFEEIFERFSNDLAFLVVDNPSIVLEYLKLYYSLRKQLKIKNGFFEEIIPRILTVINDHWSKYNSLERVDSYQYLKILSEIDKFISLKHFIIRGELRHLIEHLLEDVLFIIRENSKLGQEYLVILRNFKDYIPEDVYLNGNFNTELMDRLDRDLTLDKRFTRRSTFLYLELYLIFTPSYKLNESLEFISRFIVKQKQDHSNLRNVLKISAMLLSYQVPLELIKPLFENLPNTRELFIHSPEVVNEIISAQLELIESERPD